MRASTKPSLGALRRPARPVTGKDGLASRWELGDTVRLLVFTADSEALDPVAWAALNRSSCEQALDQYGGVLLRGFEMRRPEQLQSFIETVAGSALHYRERSSPRSRISGEVYTSTEHPPDQKIFFHNENSYASMWPGKLAFACVVPASEGGETPVSDVALVYQRLDPEVRKEFARRGVMYLRNYQPGIGLSWETVFQSNDRGEVEAYCRDAGYECEWRSGSALRTRRITPAFARHPRTGAMLWFNHAAFFHISTLPLEIRSALERQFAPDELPHQTFFGDGASIEEDVMEHIRATYQSASLEFRWHSGDLLLLDNMRLAHARNSFRGQRKVLVAMAEPCAERRWSPGEAE
jgi:alpha-ketoglutarate-dependent taurine dioxygenase